uniref:nuclear transport factor 2 family protein n=1 Tax=uncultured Dysgonomonas sp. TaxID=206096 RepID=UPI002590803E|nr:nuclear transport factor 2 family protein [uncultured Dysgonomonas sp.]
MTVEKEIVDSEELLIHAMKNADVDVLDNLISDSLIFNAPTGEIITKDMDLSTYRSGNMVLDNLDCLSREIRVFDDVVVVSAKVFMKGAFFQQLIEGEVRFLRTWKKFSGRWMVIAGSSVFIH